MQVFKKQVKHDWATILQAPFEDMTTGELMELEGAALDWEICACGNLCDAIPRSKDNGAPKDSRLRSLGKGFFHSVSFMGFGYSQSDKLLFEKHRKEAIKIHSMIEERAIEVLKELQNESI